MHDDRVGEVADGGDVWFAAGVAGRATAFAGAGCAWAGVEGDEVVLLGQLGHQVGHGAFEGPRGESRPGGGVPGGVEGTFEADPCGVRPGWGGVADQLADSLVDTIMAQSSWVTMVGDLDRRTVSGPPRSVVLRSPIPVSACQRSW